MLMGKPLVTGPYYTAARVRAVAFAGRSIEYSTAPLVNASLFSVLDIRYLTSTFGLPEGNFMLQSLTLKFVSSGHIPDFTLTSNPMTL